MKDICFKLNGCPEWFKKYKQKKFDTNTQNQTYVVDTIPEIPQEVNSNVVNSSDLSASLASILQQELSKYTKGKSLDTAEFSKFAVIYVTSHTSNFTKWIVDTRASSNMCNNLSLFCEYSNGSHM